MNHSKILTRQINLNDTLVLQKIQRALNANLTRVWPTRYLSLCPPARAATVVAEQLQIPGLRADNTEKVLIVFLPASYEQHLSNMVQTTPTVRVHPDLNLLTQEAYVSWSLPESPGVVNKSLWITVSDLLPSLRANRTCAGTHRLPVIFVAEQTVMLGEFNLDDAQLANWEQAVQSCAVGPGGYSESALFKAAIKSEKYGDRPWLLMLYELTNKGEKLAVNWAPVRNMSATTTVST